jgi:hypothetical protein
VAAVSPYEKARASDERDYSDALDLMIRKYQTAYFEMLHQRSLVAQMKALIEDALLVDDDDVGLMRSLVRLALEVQ